MAATEFKSFENWIVGKYTPAGQDYYLSENPNDFLMYHASELFKLFQSEYAKNKLAEFKNQGKEFHLVVENNKTFELLYHRDLTGEDILEISDYLPEIQQATKLQFSLIPEGSMWAGDGQIGINIAFSPPPKHDEDKELWAYEDYKIV